LGWRERELVQTLPLFLKELNGRMMEFSNHIAAICDHCHMIPSNLTKSDDRAGAICRRRGKGIANPRPETMAELCVYVFD
jgi:hypothetical protein